MTNEGGGGAARVAGLDLLRGLAAFAVAVPHFFAYHNAFPDAAETVSALAVEVFFVLSGYVLAPQILLCLASGQPRYLGVFLVRRWMRTIPPYLVALLAISILMHELRSTDFLRYLVYAQNLVAQCNTNDYFAIAWSLSVEEWFYVTFPSLLLLAAWLRRVVRRSGPSLFVMAGLGPIIHVDPRHKAGHNEVGGTFGTGDRRFAAVFGICFCVAIVAARAVFGDFADWGAAVRRVVVFRLDAIGYGFLLYLAVERWGDGWVAPLPNWFLSGLLLAAGAFAYLALAAVTADGNLFAAHAFPFLAGLFGGLAIVLALRAETAMRAMPSLARFGLYLGRTSYSTYLFHIILIEVLGAALAGRAIVLQLGLFLGVLFAFTTAFYVWFERPILAARPHYRRHPERASQRTLSPAE